ncbi:MAG: hypothetical protein K1060chlam5_00940 [Candidatus Anoxychlamydiales bacterium]|nr:hypothetical protein [Candidatus Anoxychlamydiales bacterium]
MTSIQINEKLKNDLLKFIKTNKKIDLIALYLFYVENKFKINPVMFPKEKMIYKSLEDLIKHLEKEKQLYRETEIKIQFGKESVNEDTKKIYICPFTGKAFGDNTHPNPQDAIYDWVSRCKENTERVGGLKAKRFFISDDPEIIKKYIKVRKEPITKTVFSSVINGKLFNSKKAIIEDFKKNYIKKISLYEVQSQNKFKIHDDLLTFIQDELTEEKIQEFVELLSEHKEFEKHLKKWLS